MDDLKSPLKNSFVVYKILCSRESYALPKPYYVGQILNTVSLQLTGHLQISYIKDHMKNEHHANFSRKQREENVKIMKKI